MLVPLTCPKCGSKDTVLNGSVRALCKHCKRSFRRDLGNFTHPLKNNKVFGTEVTEDITIIRF